MKCLLIMHNFKHIIYNTCYVINVMNNRYIDYYDHNYFIHIIININLYH
jgi:hypothetical protein